MKVDPINFILENKGLQNKFYFISGNEVTLMETLKDEIIRRCCISKSFDIEKVNQIKNYKRIGLFEKKKIYIIKEIKGLDEGFFEEKDGDDDIYLFFYENSPKIKRLKSNFAKKDNLLLMDCYELERSSKIKILNFFLKEWKISLDELSYWKIIDMSQNKYSLFVNDIKKIAYLNHKDLTANNINQIITQNSGSGERLFFYLLKKNEFIVNIYNQKVKSEKEVNDLFYYFRFFINLIINNHDESDYVKSIPNYLFKEKDFLIKIFRKYNFKKKETLLLLLKNTETELRKNSALSVIIGLRFLLSFKKITIS